MSACGSTLNIKSGFFTSSPFPLLQIYTKHLSVEPGEIPFGGSVSTNAVSLAELMGASNVYFVGQDLAFTGGFAHCKGAILEERLNFKESRYFKREKHNYNQLSALPKLISVGYDGEKYHSNEKMQIFQKWFGDRAERRASIWVLLMTSAFWSMLNKMLLDGMATAFFRLASKMASL